MNPYPNEDPNQQEEANRYQSPIPSRAWVLSTLDHIGKPLSQENLERCFRIKSNADKEAFRYRLAAMVRQGQLLLNRKKCYTLIEKTNLVKGTIQGHKDGFGFFVPEDGVSKDAFVPPSDMRTVMDGDTVLAMVRPSPRDKSRFEAKIVDVIERAHSHLVCQYFKDGSNHFAIPCNGKITQDILLEKPRTHINHQAYVMIEITDYPNRHQPGKGFVSNIIGREHDPYIEINVAKQIYNIPETWSEETRQYVKKLAKNVTLKDNPDHEDWTKLPFVTIDGGNAKDFDDAVYVAKNKSGFLVHVAIADVSHYVTPDSPLDKDAKERATSVYLPHQVVPMLPFELSDNLCSLVPNKIRLTLAVKIQLDHQGNRLDYSFHRAAIQSFERLTYESVQAMIDGKNKTPAWWQQGLEDLTACYQQLEKQRQQRGTLDFDTKECVFVFDKTGKIKDVKAKSRLTTHKIIEECMLLANETTATFLIKHKIPNLFRVHGKPDNEKINALNQTLQALGTPLVNQKDISPKVLAKVLEAHKGRATQEWVQMLVLRSMTNAVYQPKNEGHFGLSYKQYCHFTSPIRRYPDLVTHRAIRYLLDQQTPAPGASLIKLGEHCSMAERRADLATRYASDWLKCHFMQGRKDSYDATVVNVTSFGLFVRLNTLFIEGLVHISELSDDYYTFDKTTTQLIGQKNEKKWNIGKKCRVKVASINTQDRLIDFYLI